MNTSNPLLPYTESQSSIFFGRDVEVKRLISSLQACRLTIVYGDSKVGMTSILQAGVYAHLKPQSKESLISPSHNESSMEIHESIDLPIYIDYQNVYTSLKDRSTDCPPINLYETLAGILTQFIKVGTCSLKSSAINTQDSFIEFLRKCSLPTGKQMRKRTIYVIIDQAELALLKIPDQPCFFQDVMDPILQYSDIRFNFLLAFRENAVIRLDKFKNRRDFLVNRFEIKPLEQDVVQSIILPGMFSNPSKGDEINSSQREENILGHIPSDAEYINLVNVIMKFQSLSSQASLGGLQSSISPTYLQLMHHASVSGAKLDLEEILKSYIENCFPINKENDDRIIAAILIHYIYLSGSGSAPTANHLIERILHDRYMLVNLPFISLDFNSSNLDNHSLKNNFSKYCIDILSRLDESRIVSKHGSSYVIHPDFQLALSKWKDGILSQESQYNATRASSIAGQSIIMTMQLSQSMEMDLAKTELSGLLALQAYSYSKHANADYKISIFDDAFRQFLMYPFSTKVLDKRSEGAPNISACTLSSDNTRIATVDLSGNIYIFEADFHHRRSWEREKLVPYSVHSTQGAATGIAFHPDSNQVLVIGYSNGAVEYCILDAKLTSHSLLLAKHPNHDSNCERPTHGAGPGPVVFSHDGSWLAFGSWDHQITVWNLTAYKPDEFNLKVDGDYRLKNWEYLDDWVWSIAFSHKSNQMAVGCRNGNLLIFDLTKLEQENYLFSTYYDVIQLSDILTTTPFTGKKVLPYEPPNNRPFEIFAVAYSPEDEWIAIGSRGLACIFEPVLADRQKMSELLKQKIKEQQDHPQDENIPPIVRKTIVRYSSENERGIRSVAFSSDSKYLCIGSDDFYAKLSEPSDVQDQTLRLWDLTRRDAPAFVLRAPTNHPFGINCVLFSKVNTVTNRNTFIVTSSWDGTVRLWYLKRDRMEPFLMGEHNGPVRAVSWSPNGKWLASAAWDRHNTVRLWNCEHLWPGGKNLVEQNQQNYLPKSFYGNGSLAFSADSKLLASGGYQGDNSVHIWDVDNPHNNPRICKSHTGEVRAIDFSQKYLASGGWDRTLNIWNANDLTKPLITIEDFPGAISCLALSKNQKWLAVGTGTPIHENHGTLFSLDMKKILEKCKYGERMLFSNEIIDSVSEVPGAEIFGIAISPCSRLLASIDKNNNLRISDLEKKEGSNFWPLGSLIKEATGSDLAGSSIAFSSKGTMLAVGCWPTDEHNPTQKQGAVCLWQVNRLREEKASKVPTVLQLPPDEIIEKPGRDQYHVTSVAFSPAPIHPDSTSSSLHDSDSQFLAFASNDGTIRIWTVGSGMLAKLVANQVTRNLTEEEWNQYIDQGYGLSLYEYTLPSEKFPTPARPVPHNARPSWLAQNLNRLGCPPFSS